MAPTPNGKRRLFAAAASGEDPPRSSKAADQESDGSDEICSSDEIGVNGVVIKRQPPPKAVAAAELPEKSAGFRAMSSLKRNATRSSPRKNKEAATAASSKASARPLAPEVVAAAELPEKSAGFRAMSSLKRNATRSSPRKTKEAATAASSKASPGPLAPEVVAEAELPEKSAVVGSPHNVASPPAAAAPSGVVKGPSQQPQEGEYDADRHFKEKSRRYPCVWQKVQSLEREVSLPLKEAFLEMDDTDAEALNKEFEEISVQALKDLIWEKDNEKMVTDVLTNLIS